MILFLAEEGTQDAAKAIACALTQAYHMPVAPAMLGADAVWDRKVEWDDLLFVLFKSRALSDSFAKYVAAYRDAHRQGAAIIPVSTDAHFSKPPDPISGIKAARYDATPEATNHIVKAAGVFLGVALRPGSQRIFVSYRARDGKGLARAIYERLQAEGFQSWLDVAQENIAIGDEVQEEIRRSVYSAAMVLVIDTPDAPASDWISVEIDMANAQLVPVLPVVAGGERTSRFIQLQSLRRQALVRWEGPDAQPLSDADWNTVRGEIEELLLSGYRRRLRILTRAQAIFESYGYLWQVLDERLRMYRAEKNARRPLKTIVVTHCLVHDITYVSALQAYGSYLNSYGDLAKVNQRLCIYDRDLVLSDAEMSTLLSCIPGMNFIPAHHSQLDLLVGSGFTVLQ